MRAVRDALGLDRIHLFGSSWGGMLAMEYALTQPAGLASLVLSSSPASIPLWAEETNRLRRELPTEVQRVLDEDEAAGTARLARVRGGDGRVLQAPRLPASTRGPTTCCGRSPGLPEHPDVYMTMQGPNEFVITGTLKDWDITGRLGEIRRADADHRRPPRRVHARARPRRCTSGIPGSELVTFENSSHMQFVEEPERYLEVVAGFLDRVERR